MAQRDGFMIDGKKDAREYYWAGSGSGARRAYSSAYADARTPDTGSDADYMRNVSRGGQNYDQGRMAQTADDETARIYNRRPTRAPIKRTPPKAAARRR